MPQVGALMGKWACTHSDVMTWPSSPWKSKLVLGRFTSCQVPTASKRSTGTRFTLVEKVCVCVVGGGGVSLCLHSFSWPLFPPSPHLTSADPLPGVDVDGGAHKVAVPLPLLPNEVQGSPGVHLRRVCVGKRLSHRQTNGYGRSIGTARHRNLSRQETATEFTAALAHII